MILPKAEVPDDPKIGPVVVVVEIPVPNIDEVDRMEVFVPNKGFSEVAVEIEDATDSGALLEVVSELDPNKDGATELAKVEEEVEEGTETKLDVVIVPAIEVPIEVVEPNNVEVVVMREPEDIIAMDDLLIPEELIANVVLMVEDIIVLVVGAALAVEGLEREELELVTILEATVTLKEPVVLAPKIFKSNAVLDIV